MIRPALAFSAALLLAAVAPAAAQPRPAAAAEVRYVQAGRLLADPATGRVETDKTLVISGGKVVEIRDGFHGSGPRVIDLRDSFVLPGLIDSHVHLLFQNGPNVELEGFKKTSADLAFDGYGYAKKTLRAGFTTVVDLGSDPDAIYALRDAIAAGKVQGPRIIAAGGVGAHGGHADIHGYRPDVMKLFSYPGLCSGADDCRRAVRQASSAGPT